MPAYCQARRLYERSGYHLEAVVHDFYAPGDDLVIYAKDLVDAGVWGRRAAPAELVTPGRTLASPIQVAG